MYAHMTPKKMKITDSCNRVKDDLDVSLSENTFGVFWPVRTGRNR